MTTPHSQGSRASGVELETELVTGTTAGDEQASSARGQIRQVKDQVVDQAKSTFREARDKAGSSLGDSRRQAAEQIGGLGAAIHSASSHLRGENQERIAGLADSLGDQVEQVASYLRDADFDRMVRDVESLARRQPALVFGAALAIGILGARFLKSSDSSRSRRFKSGQDEYEEYGFGGSDVGA